MRTRRLSRRATEKRQKAVAALAATCYGLLRMRARGASAEAIDEQEYMVHYEEGGCLSAGLSEETIAETKAFIFEILPGVPSELRDAMIRAKRWTPWPACEED